MNSFVDRVRFPWTFRGRTLDLALTMKATMKASIRLTIVN